MSAGDIIKELPWFTEADRRHIREELLEITTRTRMWSCATSPPATTRSYSTAWRTTNRGIHLIETCRMDFALAADEMRLNSNMNFRLEPPNVGCYNSNLLCRQVAIGGTMAGLGSGCGEKGRRIATLRYRRLPVGGPF